MSSQARNKAVNKLLGILKMFRRELDQFAMVRPEFVISQIKKNVDLEDPKIDIAIMRAHDIIHEYLLGLQSSTTGPSDPNWFSTSGTG